jgi:hypothetical protein
MTEAEWLNAVDAIVLWANVRNQTRFYRQIVDRQELKYNRRILYLLGVAICHRIARQFPDPCCHRMLQVAEAFAEGTAVPDELFNAHHDVETVRGRRAADLLPAASGAAIEAVFWLGPDDYKVIHALEYVVDAAGYSQAVAEGVLSATATMHDGRAIWQHPVFLAGRGKVAQALCYVIRDVIGNPFRPAVLDPAWLTWHDGAVRKMAQAIYDERRFGDLPILADALEDAGCADAAILAHCRETGEHVRGCWVVDLLLGKS